MTSGPDGAGTSRRTVERFGDRPALVDGVAAPVLGPAGEARRAPGGALRSGGIAPWRRARARARQRHRLRGHVPRHLSGSARSRSRSTRCSPWPSWVCICGLLRWRASSRPRAGAPVDRGLDGGRGRVGHLGRRGRRARPRTDGDQRAPPTAQPDLPALYAFSSGSDRHSQGDASAPRPSSRTRPTTSTTPSGVSEDDVILASVALFHAHGLGNCLLAAVRVRAATGAAGRSSIGTRPWPYRDGAGDHLPDRPVRRQTLAETRRARPCRHRARCGWSSPPARRWRGRRSTFSTSGSGRRSASCTAAARPARSPSTLTTTSARPPASVGRPMKGIDLAVVGEHGESRAPGENGEITFASPAAATGYVGVDPERQRRIPRRLVPHRRPRPSRRRRQPVRHRPHQAVHLHRRLQGRPVRGRERAPSPPGRRRRRGRRHRRRRGARRSSRPSSCRARTRPTRRELRRALIGCAGPELAVYKVPRDRRFPRGDPPQPAGQDPPEVPGLTRCPSKRETRRSANGLVPDERHA